MAKTKKTTRLHMQQKNGFTPTGRVSRHTDSMPVRDDITREECVSLVGVLQLLIAYPFIKAYLVHNTVHEIIAPMTHDEKQQLRLKEAKENAAVLQQTITARSAEVQVSTGSQVASAPVSPVPVAAATPPPAVIPAPFRDPVGHGFDFAPEKPESNSWPTGPLVKPGMTAGGDGAAEMVSSHSLQASRSAVPVKNPLPGGIVMERIRANGYRVHLEDLYKSPFANTVAHKSVAPLEKIDVPVIYGDGP